MDEATLNFAKPPKPRRRIAGQGAVEYRQSMRTNRPLFVFLVALFATTAQASELKPGDSAPLFTAKTQNGETFDLATRKGTWTVLFFYPKAGTPGCTKEVCAFRDSIQTIREQGADVYGISVNSVEDQAAFHAEHHLAFTLLADPEGDVVEKYGAKMPVVTMAKRWTFIIDPDLKIRQIERDVDPALDAKRVATEIARLKQSAGAPAPN
jgi:peroxiredoxin Q/BCP